MEAAVKLSAARVDRLTMSRVVLSMEAWLIVAALGAMMAWFSLRTLSSYMEHEIASRRLERQTRELRLWHDERLRRKRGGASGQAPTAAVGGIAASDASALRQAAY